MNDKKSCAERIQEALAIRGLTQIDLCRLTGIGKSAMSQYVNGAIVPRQDRTFLIARALNVSEPWLMGFDVPMEREKPPEALSDERFAELFNDLDARDQDTVLRLMQSMRDARSER